MAGRLLIIFLVVPLVELYLLLKFSSITSIPTTIALVVITGVGGSFLAAQQGGIAIRNFRLAVSEGRIPGVEVVDGILIAFAAALLLTPGLLSDSLGILLLIPWSRTHIRRWLVRRYSSKFSVTSFSGAVHAAGGRSAPHDIDGGTVDASFRQTSKTTPDSHYIP